MLLVDLIASEARPETRAGGGRSRTPSELGSAGRLKKLCQTVCTKSMESNWEPKHPG